MTDQTKAITVTNYDKIKALAHNQATIVRFAAMLGSKPYAMSYISSAMLAVANSPDLMECTPSSVFNSVMRAAALRLSCDPAMKQAHIVPFYNNKTGKRDAQFIPGYVGLNQMAMRTGKYRVLNCSYIREGQVIDIDELTGIPNIHGQRSGDTILGYFHYFELFDGFKHILYMTVEELHAHGQKYAAKNPLWKSNFDAMARKTVTRLHLLKNGILDPYDRSMVEAASEDIEQESTIINREDTVDGAFSEVDDETAAIEAAARKIEEKNRPKASEAELVGDLTGEPVKQEAPVKAWKSTKISMESAQELAGSDKVRYWELDTTTLTARHGFVLNSLADTKKEKTPEKIADLELRRDTIAAIIEYRK
ncbi:MAG: recombinase RecT [Gallionella sp.]|jgi:recombination protein RecT